MNVYPGSGYVRIERAGSTYNVKATTPNELRKRANEEEVRAVRRDDASAMKRALIYRQAADIWEQERAEEEQRKRRSTAAKRAATQREKDTFTARYGTGAEKERANRRLGR